jgi:cupin fold WbuC family metalloprotein
VWYARGPLTAFGEAEITFLKAQAALSPRRRSRICAHASPEALVHEMLIAHHRTCYVRPHRHPEKAESLTVVEGRARAIFYDDGGTVSSVLRLAEPPSETFAYRVGPGRYHSLLIESEWLIFLEVAQGPFSTASSAFPAWAPDGNDVRAVSDFEARVSADADSILASKLKS